MDHSELVEALVLEATQVLEAGLQAEATTVMTRDLDGIERCLHGLLRQVGGALIERLAQSRQATMPTAHACAQCGGALRLVDRARPRRLEGLVGPVRLRRAWYHCAACHTGSAPLDSAWRLGPGVLSPGAARAVSRAGLEVSFAQAADLVADLLGVAVSPDTVRSVSEGLGQVAEVAQGDPTRWQVPQERVPTTLAVTLDGVFVHQRDRWREVKVGRIAPLGPALTAADEAGSRHLALGPSTYAVAVGTARDCWERVAREARRAGLGRGVQTVVVLGDGARWIWDSVAWYLGEAGVRIVEVLDFYHAAQHLAAVADVVFGPGTPAAAAWLAETRHRLRHEGPPPVLAALAALAPPNAEAAADVRRLVAFVTRHAPRMAYPAFRAAQLPIGSGAIESTAKNLIQVRQTQAGMRWTQPGAQQVASLRALHRSGRWAAFWQEAPQTRLRLVRVQAAAAADMPDEDEDELAEEAAVTARATTPNAVPTVLAAGPEPLAAADQAAATRNPTGRITTAGKVWAKGKDHWQRGLLLTLRSA